MGFIRNLPHHLIKAFRSTLEEAALADVIIHVCDASDGEFAAQLQEKSGLEVVLWDERGSSVTANRILSDAGKKRDKQRARVDAVAAQVILQSYLDFYNMQKNR